MSKPHELGWLIVPNTHGFPYDENFPYLVVNVSNKPVARFANRYAAVIYVDEVLERWGRVVETKENDGTVSQEEGESRA